MAIFQKHREKKLSVPLPDDAEARWKREEAVPFSAMTDPWIGTEGELAVDVYLNDQSVIVRTAMAGVDPDDVQISLMNDLLTIRGERKEEERVQHDQYFVQECHWGSFSRSVVLPVPVTSDGAEAVMKNGVLKIILQRAPASNVSVRVIQAIA